MATAQRLFRSKIDACLRAATYFTSSDPLILLHMRLYWCRMISQCVLSKQTNLVIDLNVRRKMSVGRSGAEHSGQKNLRRMFDITSTL